MLKHLFIKNYALIDVLDIDFQSGFSVITGETGAGKSIILGAIGLLLGQRVDTKSIKPDAQKCTIEATFEISGQGITDWLTENDFESDDNVCIIRREITSTGKSRGFINDTPATLVQMKELGEKLLDIHSQHKNLLLQKEDFQLNVLDIIAGDEKELDIFSRAYNAYHRAHVDLIKLRNDARESKEKEDYMRFQLNELTNAELVEDEQEKLEIEQDVASHTEEIKGLLYGADSVMNDDNGGVVALLRQVNQKISAASAIYPKIQSLSERLNSVFIDVKDIAQECALVSEEVEYDPEHLTFINDRLDLIYSLERKYGVDNISDLCKLRDNLAQDITNIDNIDDVLSEKEKEVHTLFNDVKKKAEVLSSIRRKAILSLEEQTKKYLNSLGIPNAVFNVDIQTKEIGIDGQDKVQFMFSANKGMPTRPVEQVASGGEIARLMLTLKAIISGTVKLPTIIFDEIDTGVSGKVAEQMALIMREMGNADRQVISITHLPQIAASGKYHYKVEKHDTDEGSISVMRSLSDDERVIEIAQMLSGSDVTEAAKANAIALLNSDNAII